MPSVQEKGQKLADEGKVVEVPVSRAFYVKGQSDTYLVTIIVVPPADYPGTPNVEGASCTCTWGRSGNPGYCSHVNAAAVYAVNEAKERTDGRV